MDIYKKRKQRQNKTEEQNIEQNQSEININWDISIYGNTSSSFIK